jgi:hypothetical protein
MYDCFVLALTGVVVSLLLHGLASSVLLCGHFCVRNTGFKFGRVIVCNSSVCLK